MQRKSFRNLQMDPWESLAEYRAAHAQSETLESWSKNTREGTASRELKAEETPEFP